MGLWARVRGWLGKGRISAYWRGDPRTYQRIYVPEHWNRRVGQQEAPAAVRFHHGESGGGGSGSSDQKPEVIKRRNLAKRSQAAAEPSAPEAPERGVNPWPPGFPELLRHAEWGELKCAAREPKEALDRGGQSRAYRAAKAGDPEAARRVVAAVVNNAALVSLAKRHPKARLLAVHKPEPGPDDRMAPRPNALAKAYAMHISARTGLTVSHAVVQANDPGRIHANAEERLVLRVKFAGTVAPGEYILVDDMVTSGGTLAWLRTYVESFPGARVVEMTSLAATRFHPDFGSPDNIAILPATHRVLSHLDVTALNRILKEQEVAHGYQELSNGQVRFLLRCGSIDTIRDRVAEACRRAAATRAVEAVRGGPQEVPPSVGEQRSGHAPVLSPAKPPLKKSFWHLPGYVDAHGFVRLGTRPAPPPAAPDPPADPPRAPLPFSQPLPPGATRIHIKGTPTAAQALILHHELFPAAGTYLLTKATPVAGLEDREALDQWEEWFLRALEDRARERFGSSQEAIWDVLDELLRQRGVAAPSMVDSYEMHRTLFDLSHASTARMVGLRLPDEVRTRLEKLGWHDLPILDFPAVAFRLAMISQRLMQQPPVTWPELVKLADAVPLSSVERAAVDIARSRAGMYLKPIYDASGQLWQIERELEPLRQRVAHAIEHRIPVREAARLHGNAQRLEGIARDAQRTLVTEIAEARGQAAWMQEVKHAPADAKFFRQTAANACRGCYRLLKNPDGTPRLFSRAELDAGEAEGVNRGNWREWHLRAGPLHPQCRCAPPAQWHAEMADIFADRAPTYAAEMERLGVFKQAA